MGVGNFYLEGAETVYIDKEQVYGKLCSETNGFEFIRCDGDYDFRVGSLIEHILDHCPATFEPGYQGRYPSKIGVDVAESGFYLVTVVDWEDYFAVNVVIKDEFEENGLARFHHWKTAGAIFDSLSAVYSLRVRCGAQTSGSYVLHKAA